VKRKDWKAEAQGLAAALHLAETHVDELRRGRDEAIVETHDWKRRHSELSAEHDEQRDRRAVERRSLRRMVAAMEWSTPDEGDLDLELARAVQQARAALRLDPELYEAELDDPCRWLRAGDAILDAQAADPGDSPSAGELGDARVSVTSRVAGDGHFVSDAIRQVVGAEQERLREVARHLGRERTLTGDEARDAIAQAMRVPEPDDDPDRVQRIRELGDALPIGTPISVTLPDWSRPQTFQVAQAGRYGDAVWYGLALPTLPRAGA
jgi:hypothetical protein